MSFRLSSRLSDRMDEFIDRSDGKIRDRTEFGTKAILFYLDYIENYDSLEFTLANAILALGEYVGIEQQEIRKLQETRDAIPSIPQRYPAKDPITHPDYDKLLGVVNRFRENEYEEYETLRDLVSEIQYSDISRIYDEYKEKFLQKNR